jgi:hypothetical protein
MAELENTPTYFQRCSSLTERVLPARRHSRGLGPDGLEVISAAPEGDVA